MLPATQNNDSSMEPQYEGMDSFAGTPAPASGFKLHKFLHCLLRFWYIPVLTLILGGAGTGFYVMKIPPTFISRASMWETVKLRLPEGGLFSEDIANFLGTQTELLKSGRLRELTLTRMRALSTNALPLEANGQPLGVNINVSASAKSSVFLIEAYSSNPTFVQSYLEALIGEYLQYKKDIRKTVSSDTLASISEQVLRLEQELKAAQEALTSFQRTNNLAILEEEGKVAGSYLSKLDTQVSDLRLEQQFLEVNVSNSVPGKAAANATNAAPTSVADVGIQSLSQAGSSDPQNPDRQIALLQIQREKLSQNLKPKHPKIVKLDEEIERLRKINEMIHNQSKEQILASRQATQMKMAGLQEAIKEWQVKVMVANSRIAEAEHLKLNVNRIQAVYDRLVGLLQNIDISRNIDQDTLAVLEPPCPAWRSYKEETSKATTGVVMGFAVGLGIVFLIARRDDKFRSTVEVCETFGDVVVGQVPDIKGFPAKTPLSLIKDEEQRHMYAESYRNLRSALFFLANDGARPRVILITSAVPNEGKSTIASNLAQIIALGGSRVLLIDGDMRRGFLHDLMGHQRGEGLTDLLKDPTKLDEVIQIDGVPNLFFMSRGGNVENPGDLLLRPHLGSLLTELRHRFDYVLIDSSPVFASDDATTLAPKMDGTLFIVRSKFSRAKSVQQAIDLLTQRQARILGMVFNRADTTGHAGYYYKYANYHQTTRAE